MQAVAAESVAGSLGHPFVECGHGQRARHSPRRTLDVRAEDKSLFLMENAIAGTLPGLRGSPVWIPRVSDMRNLFLALSAAALFAVAAAVIAQTPETTQAQSSIEKPVETATQPDPGTKMRLAAMDTSDAAFRKLDHDTDGRISALEAADSPKVAAAFTMADKDKDGYLSKEEFEAMNPASPNAMKEVDASSPSGDRATEPSGDRASYPSGDQPATGPNEPTPTDNSPSPRRVARPPRP
jgi:EF hand